MMPFFTESYGNPHSRSHSFGWDTEQACEDARENIASLVGATGKEIIFTSGATESNNLCLKGLASFYGDKKRHIITTQIDHKCVLDPCRKLEDEGFDDEIKEFILDTLHFCLLVNTDDALQHEGMEVFTELLCCHHILAG